MTSHRNLDRTLQRAALTGEPITTREATLAGWTRSAQRHAVTAGRLVRVRHGVLAAPLPSSPGHPARCLQEAELLRSARAAALACTRAAISHLSAGVAFDIPTYGPIDLACLTVPARTALRDLASVHLHRATLSSGQLRILNGFTVTSPARTVLDIARENGVDAGVVAADHALRERLVTGRDLAAELALCAGWPGIRAARAVVELADARSESVLESVSRMRILQTGLTHPEPQVCIYDRRGTFLGRSDFYWDDYGVIGEADGDIKYREDDDALARQVARQTSLEETGLVAVRWGWSDLFEFDAVERRIEDAARRRTASGAARRAWIAVPT